MRFPKLIKKEYYSANPDEREFWIHKLCFLFNKRLREEFLIHNDIRKVYKKYKKNLRAQRRMKRLYMYVINPSQSNNERKPREWINKHFLEIETFFTEYMFSIGKAVYLLDLPKV